MKLRFKSIRAELVVVSSFAIGILLVVIIIFTANSVSNRTEKNIKQGLESTLQLEVNKIEGFIETKGNVVEIFLANPQLTDWFSNYTERYRDLTNDSEYKKITRMFKNIVSNDDSIKAVFFASSYTGNYFKHTGRTENKKYYATKRPWWGRAVKIDRLFITTPQIDYADKKIVSSIKKTVYNDKGDLIGIAGIDILLATLKKEVSSKLKYQGQGDAFLINNDGAIIIFPVDDDKAQKIGSLSNVDAVLDDSDGFSSLSKIMLANESGIETVTWKGEPHIVGFKRISLEKPYVNWMAGLILPASIKNKPIRKAIITSILEGVGIVVTLIIIILLTARRITNPLKKLVHAMENIAQGEGDLTIRLEEKEINELGLLAHWFNLFIEKIQLIIREITQNAENLNKSAYELSQISGLMSENIETTSEKTGEVSSSSDTMSQNMNSVATAMEEAATNVGMIASATEEMTSTIHEIAKNTESARSITDDAVTQTRNTSVQVKELGAAAKEIGNVVETITDISSKVNLLALNATIEAARAGEAGRGFAVVAGEIKDLAQQTATATGEIKAKVAGIQSSTNSTVTEIVNITDVVNKVNEIVTTIATAIEEQSVTTNEIASNVNNVSGGIAQINDNAAQSNTIASQIATEIAEVTSTTEDLSGRSRNVKENADNLSQLSNSLNEIVGRFKI